MKDVHLIAADTYWLGGSDRRLALFENLFPIPRGVSYNSYLILDEKTLLLDTVDSAVAQPWLENLTALLAGRPLDYLVISHMEPDHCAQIARLTALWPDLKLVVNAKTCPMLRQFFGTDWPDRQEVVAEGSTLSTGRHTLRFAMAPMVHWPEVMVSFDEATGALYTADGFGTFGALDGAVFADQVNFERDWLDDARRYYANIVGKYGASVQGLLKKAAALPVKMLCPLHGPIWRKDLDWFLEKYDRWSRWQPEGSGVMVVYGSMYGNTARAAELFAGLLAEGGAEDLRVYDASITPVSHLIGEAFRCKQIVLACPTYNGGVYPAIEAFVNDMKALALQGRTFALLENGSWAPAAARLLRPSLEAMKNTTVLEPVVTIRGALREDQMEQLSALRDAVLAGC